jgi:hypothetical protein
MRCAPRDEQLREIKKGKGSKKKKDREEKRIIRLHPAAHFN